MFDRKEEIFDRKEEIFDRKEEIFDRKEQIFDRKEEIFFTIGELGGRLEWFVDFHRLSSIGLT